MLPSAILTFREVLEAAIIVGIVLAASRGVAGRGGWIAAGILAGVAGSCAVAVFAESIAAAASGIGQELLNAAILFTAVAMLGWHNVWMGRHGRELAQEASALGGAVGRGARPLYALAIVIGMAVMREGSELVLFLMSVAAGGGGAGELAAGFAMGVLGGGAVGALIYFGLLGIPMRHLFTVTSWLILLLAAGLASQGAGFLVQADILPALGSQLWDTSALVSDDGLAGKVLHTLIGYVARPAGIQLVFWAATLLVIAGLMRAASPQRSGGIVLGAAAIAMTLSISLAAMLGIAA